MTNAAELLGALQRGPLYSLGGLLIHVNVRTAVVADVSYRRFATTGRMPRGLAPITLGVELQ